MKTLLQPVCLPRSSELSIVVYIYIQDLENFRPKNLQFLKNFL